jgi:hypothetical protein
MAEFRDSHIICVYKCPLAETLYKIDLVDKKTCDVYDGQLDTFYPRKVTVKYYISFSNGSAEFMYKQTQKYMSKFTYGKNGFYDIKNFKKHFYRYIHFVWRFGCDFVIVNNIDDRRDTVCKKFINRLRKANILCESDYMGIEYNLDFPISTYIYLNFSWENVPKKVPNVYDVETAKNKITEMIKDKELYEKLKLMEDDKCLITLMQIDKKIPCLDSLVIFCRELFANK